MTDPTNTLGDMPSEDFRRYGYQVVDWIADYFARIDEFPVLSQVEPNWLKNSLPDSPPEKGEDLGSVLDDVDWLIIPAVTTQRKPLSPPLDRQHSGRRAAYRESMEAP